MEERTQSLIAECARQEESCRYSSATLFEWLKALRFWRGWFVVLPIVAGALASWQIIADDPSWKLVTALCALVAGVTPAVYKALDFDVNLDVIGKAAHQYKVLQDRFRQAKSIAALGDFDSFKAEFDVLMNSMDEVRATSLTAPERFFKKAQDKIARGDYDFGVDQARKPRVA